MTDELQSEIYEIARRRLHQAGFSDFDSDNLGFRIGDEQVSESEFKRRWKDKFEILKSEVEDEAKVWLKTHDCDTHVDKARVNSITLWFNISGTSAYCRGGRAEAELPYQDAQTFAYRYCDVELYESCYDEDDHTSYISWRVDLDDILKHLSVASIKTSIDDTNDVELEVRYTPKKEMNIEVFHAFHLLDFEEEVWTHGPISMKPDPA